MTSTDRCDIIVHLIPTVILSASPFCRHDSKQVMNEKGGFAEARRFSMDNLNGAESSAPPSSAPLQLSDASQFPALGGGGRPPGPGSSWRGGRAGDESFTAPTTPTGTTPGSPLPTTSALRDQP